MGNDPVKTSNHYAWFKIELARFIMENDLPFCAGNVIKYECRYDAKSGVEDLKRARQYLDMQIKRMEGEADWLGRGGRVPVVVLVVLVKRRRRKSL